MNKLDATLSLLSSEFRDLSPHLITLGVDVQEISTALEVIADIPDGMASHKLAIARDTRKKLHKLVKNTTKHKRFSLAKRTLISLAKRVEKIKNIAIDIDKHS